MNISNIVEIISYSIFALIMLYIVICFFDTFLAVPRSNNKYLFLFVVSIYMIGKNITYLYPVIPFLNIIMSTVILYILTTLYKTSIGNKILAILLETIFVMSIEAIVPYSYSLVINISIRDLLASSDSMLFMNAITILFLLVSVKVYQFSLASSNNNKRNLSFFYYLQITFIPLASMCIIYFLHTIAQFDNSYFNRKIIICSFLILSINIIFYYLYEKILKSSKVVLENELLSKQIEYYISQNTSIENNLKEIQTIKHDLKHQLIYIQSKLKTNVEPQMTEAAQELSKLIGTISINRMEMYTDNSVLNTILNYKIAVAKEKKIEVDIKVEISNDKIVNERIVDEKTLCIILGNALDNAIESFNLSEAKLECIMIRIYEEKGNVYIKISNPYNHKIRFVNNLPISNKQDKKHHGIGLKSIRNLIESSNGYLKIVCEKNIFNLEIVFFQRNKL